MTNRLRAITERHAARIDELITQAEKGEPIDWTRFGLLSDLELAAAGPATLLDALERQEVDDVGD